MSAPTPSKPMPSSSMVSKTMLIESDLHQTRIAVMEEGALAELYIERSARQGLVGNIYKGRVNRVLPGMQAAFVDIGAPRDAFLYVGEVFDPGSSADTGGKRADQPPIDELLRRNQEIVVQVLKDALPNKGARVSTQITLPGRYLVYLPQASELGISRRIEAPEERDRLLAMLQELKPDDGGLILRTAGSGRAMPELVDDLGHLRGRWQAIEKRARTATAPACLHRDLDLAERVVRDNLSAEFTVVWVADEVTYERIRTFVDGIEPALAGRVRLDAYTPSLFARFGIEKAIDAALARKVPLASGGSLVIESTEALVTIDVNTGRFVGSTNLEETVLATNLEAVLEAARQIRLRNLGGIIVLDLIDMEQEEHRLQVLETLEGELVKDRAKTNALPITEFGLLQITRKRNRASLERQMTRRCARCKGTGRVRSVAAICLEIRHQILLDLERLRGTGGIHLRLHPDVAGMLERGERSLLDDLKRAVGAEIVLEPDHALPRDGFEIHRAP